MFSTGNLTYLPNIEAIQIISQTIAPRVQEEVADVKFVIAGKKKSDLDASGLMFTGFVDNIADVLSTSNVGIAPLLHGSGTRLKILEYFSSGIPVVSTSVGAEGLKVKDGYNIFIDDDPEDFAAKIVQLLKDDKLSSDVGLAGREAAANYDWKKIAEELGRHYQNHLEQHLRER